MSFHTFIRPLLFSLDAEVAHHLALRSAAFAASFPPARHMVQSSFYFSDSRLQFKLGSLEFKSPLGLAAGMDKNGIALSFWPALGFGFAEMGTVTLMAQAGQNKPRMFRIPHLEALINRLGFPNDGAEVISDRLKKQKTIGIPLGINIGKSKVVLLEDAVENYLKTFEWLYPCGDYFAINVSSPNTPDLRKMQEEAHLSRLLKSLQEKNREFSKTLKIQPKPLLVKISPDLTEEQLESVVGLAIENQFFGIIATNTQPVESDLREKWGDGGLSGRPLFGTSTEVIRQIYRFANRKLTIVGCGGVFSAEEAYAKMKAGASLVQLYTGLVYEGPGLIKRINQGLVKLLERDGVKNILDVVGTS
jgi:dihydroorotate dehydrogenase